MAYTDAVKEGTVHKCPNCGEIIPAFTVKCPSCGFEFRDSDSVKQFEEQLKEIEVCRKPEYISDENGSHRIRTKEDEQIISLIRNFPVPNTKEGILELMNLASSSINSLSYIDANEANNTIDRDISEAWAAKTKQIYQKADLMFSSDPDFARIESMYKGTLTEVKTARRKASFVKNAAIIGLIAFLVVDFLILFGIQAKKDYDEKTLDTKMNAIVTEVEREIKNKDWDAALDKTEQLYYDKDVDKQKYKRWESKRKSLQREIKWKKFKDGINPFD